MTLNDFIKNNIGKKLDWDNSYGAQCTDLFRFYCKEVLEISQPKSVVGAADFWQNYDTDTNLKNNFTKVSNTPDGVPKAGDVMIWTRKYGPYGHIAIVTKADINSFTCLSQNDPVGQPTISKTYKYVNVYGWLSPKVQITQDSMTKTYTQEEWDKLRAENQDNWDKWQSQLKENEILKSTIQVKDEKIKSLEEKHQSLVEFIIAKISPLVSFVDNSEEAAKQAILDVISKQDVLAKEIKDTKEAAEKKERELVKANEDLLIKLETVQAKFDKMVRQHAEDIESMQENIDKLQKQIDIKKQKEAQNDAIKKFITSIINKLKG